MHMISTCLAVCALLVLSAASPAPAPRIESVEAAANRTLCPYAVELDEDLTREPQRIKVIRCLSADKTHAPARRHHAHGHAHVRACSDVRAATQRAHCVELHDVVRVRYGARATSHDVAVGCACMFLEHGVAQDPLDAVR